MLRREDGSETGLVRERSLVHENGDLHGTSHVWIVRPGETGSFQLLLQKRSLQKDSYPGCYDISSAGHVPAGSNYLDSALRELEEELGIKARPEDLKEAFLHLGYAEAEFHGKPFKNAEVSMVYLYDKPVELSDLSLQEAEVEEVRWMDYEECMQHILRKDPKFCIHPDEYGRVCEYIRTKVLRMEGKEELTTQEPKGRAEEKLSPTWNEDCLAELDEWIESQGIYLRQ